LNIGIYPRFATSRIKHAADNITSSIKIIFLNRNDIEKIDVNAIFLYSNTPTTKDSTDNKIAMRAALDDDDWRFDKGRQLNAYPNG